MCHAGKKSISTPLTEASIFIADPSHKIKRKRQRIYDNKVLEALKKIWAILDYPCSLRLKDMLLEPVPEPEKHGKLALDEICSLIF